MAHSKKQDKLTETIPKEVQILNLLKKKKLYNDCYKYNQGDKENHRQRIKRN